MQRIDHATAVNNLPTPSAQGTPGFFIPGDPITNTAATIVTADWLNQIQEEVIAVITASGLTPSKTMRTQLRDAIVSLAVEQVRTQFGAEEEDTRGTEFYSPGYDGYQILPSNLRIAWCLLDFAMPSQIGHYVDATLNYPIEFNTVWMHQVSIRDKDPPAGAWESGEMVYGVISYSTTDMTVRVRRISGTNPYGVEKITVCALILGI